MNMKAAPADEVFAEISKPAGEKRDRGHEGVHPTDVSPHTPSFPAPHGIDRQELVDAGVDHKYYGATEQADDGDDEDTLN